MHAENGHGADDTFPDMDSSSLLVISAAFYVLSPEMTDNLTDIPHSCQIISVTCSLGERNTPS